MILMSASKRRNSTSLRLFLCTEPSGGTSHLDKKRPSLDSESVHANFGIPNTEYSEKVFINYSLCKGLACLSC